MIGRQLIICQRCKSDDTIVDYRVGDIICRNCGEVFSDRIIDQSNEKINYSTNDPSAFADSRTSGYSDSCDDLRTEFICNSASMKKSLERALKFSKEKKQISILGKLHTISELCSRLNLVPSIKDSAVELFKETLVKNLVVTTDKDHLITACVYLACRVQGFPRTIDEISVATETPARRISQLQGLISRGLKLSLMRVTPAAIVYRLGSGIPLPHPVCQGAVEICQQLSQVEMLESASPQLVAAAVLLLVSLVMNKRVDLNRLSLSCHCSTPAVVATYARLGPVLSLILPLHMKKTYSRELASLPVDLATQVRETTVIEPRVVEKKVKREEESEKTLEQLVDSVLDTATAVTSSSSSSSTDVRNTFNTAKSGKKRGRPPRIPVVTNLIVKHANEEKLEENKILYKPGLQGAKEGDISGKRVKQESSGFSKPIDKKVVKTNKCATEPPSYVDAGGARVSPVSVSTENQITA